eukprot:TRINITY_DN110_c0_g1_i4.p1 TRINITY_DN110_c0_g1~~TRINITY_DN110_c0_g1_i4.p1  ORF type:complete len:193 (-),score=42.26 TRINITY_DN110_c0_g1_i4:28-606(-)
MSKSSKGVKQAEPKKQTKTTPAGGAAKTDKPPRQAKAPKAAGAKKQSKKTTQQKPKEKALAAKKAIKKGTRTRVLRKVRTTAIFRPPMTLRLPRNPKFPRFSLRHRNKLDQYTIIRSPVSSESAMKKIEDQNTLVFYVHSKANKHHINEAVFKLYKVKAAKVNTLVTPKGKKKAYVKLTGDFDALELSLIHI